MGKPVEDIHYDSFDTSVTFYQQTRRNNLEDSTLQEEEDENWEPMNLKKSNNVAVSKTVTPQEEEQRGGDLRFS